MKDHRLLYPLTLGMRVIKKKKKKKKVRGYEFDYYNDQGSESGFINLRLGSIV